jgi:hypothetical protein
MNEISPFHDRPAARPRVTAQVLFGLFVIVVGVLFTLDNMELIHAEDYLRYWPAVFVAVGAVKLLDASKQGHGWVSGVILLSIGVVMLLERITYVRFDFGELWPLLIVALGAYLVWRGFGGTRRPAQGDSASVISGFAMMGGFERRSNASAFAGGDLTALLGGCEVDLRKASISPNVEAVIDVFALGGGIDLRVPEDWTVVSQVVPIMGGVEDKTVPPEPPGEKRLVLRGLVLMGGVSVKN